MLANLYESQPHRSRSSLSAITSVSVHAGLIGAAVWATTQASAPLYKAPDPPTIYVPISSPAPWQPQRQSTGAPARRSNAEPTLPPPPQNIVIPDIITDYNVALPDVTSRYGSPDVNEFRGNDLGSGGPNITGGRGGRGGGPGLSSSGTEYTIAQVERPAALDRAHSPEPDYPPSLHAAGIEGQVDVRFAVDSSGRCSPKSIAVQQASNELFALAVRRALPRMRFFPAEIGGRPVAQLVQQTFYFTIRP